MNGSAAAARIALGTAQFGLPYGVANTRGQISEEEGGAILSLARGAGLRTLDTAIAYGDSESRLGRLGVREWQVITKLPAMPDDTASAADWVPGQVAGSMARLRAESLHGLLLHRPAQLCGSRGRGLYEALVRERESGRVERIGVSIYAPDELDALPPGMRFDIVQAPWSVLDQRMTGSGWAARLREEGCEFHARSLFLQGLLLMPPQARPPRFARWNSLLGRWDAWLARHGLDPLKACVGLALNTPGIDKVVVGVDSAAHLSQIIAAAGAGVRLPSLPTDLATDDVGLLNPALWSTA